MDNINLTVAKNLSDLRKQNKLTQLEVAEKLNYSDKAVSKWEQGESLPGIEVLYRLSRLYGVSLDYLVGDEKAARTKGCAADSSQPPQNNHPFIGACGLAYLHNTLHCV